MNDRDNNQNHDMLSNFGDPITEKSDDKNTDSNDKKKEDS
jgi:hypothetical protein